MKFFSCGLILLVMIVSFAGAEEYEPVTMIVAKWGNGIGEFGLRLEAEGNCPQSISVDARGNLAILDAVNRRIQLYSTLGNWLKSIPVTIQAFDVKYVDDRIFILDPYNYFIEEFNHIGKHLRKVEINQKIDMIDGLRFDGNQVCIQTYEQKQYCVGSSNSKTVQIQSERAGLSGNSRDVRFQTRWLNQHEGALLIEDDQSKNNRTIPIHCDESIGSIIFLDTDKYGHIFIRLELFDQVGKSIFEIHKLNSKGEPVSKFRIQNSNRVMPYRPIALDSEGNVYSMQILDHGFFVVKWRVKR
ncbi:MAG: hypothetical protein ACOY90_07035 [Candidatus Zhuqueibacterota bacterium]